MMQMLEAGGVPVVTDNIRKPDKDNPKGYYELEKVKKIKEDSNWLKDCRGKVFKMVSLLLYDLPNDRAYKIIFMRRKMEEVLASQKAMLSRMGKRADDISDSKMAKNFTKHISSIESWLESQDKMDVRYIDYSDVIAYPAESAKTINRFMGGGLKEDNMVSAVDHSLYRQKQAAFKDDGLK